MLKRLLTSLAFIFAFVVGACAEGPFTAPLALELSENTASGFDEYGYNEMANKFNDLADGVDRNLDGTVWGSPTYANDRLVMGWNNEWENCNANRSPENCAGAKTFNQWNGQNGGSGEVWQYRIEWIGTCRPATETDPGNIPVGGYCIWNEYAVTMSHGTVANQHFWDAHAKRINAGDN